MIVGVKPSRDQHVDRVLLQRQFEQHRFVLQEVEAVAGDAGAAFEVDQVVLLAELRRGRAAGNRTGATCDVAAAQLAAGVLAADAAHRDASGSASLSWIASASAPSRSMLGLRRRPSARGARRPSSLRASRSASSLAWPIDLLDLVRLRDSSSTSCCIVAALRFELDEPVDVGLHAALRRSSAERGRRFRG